MTNMSRLIIFARTHGAMTHGIEALLWGLTVFDKVQLASRPCFQGKLLRQLRYLLKPT